MSSDSSPLLQPTSSAQHHGPLGGFLERLLQTLEDRRPGLTDEAVKRGENGAGPFFVEVYEKELPRLQQAVREHLPHLSEPAAAAFFQEVDRLMRSVVLPAYLRLSVAFTPRERNDFYLLDKRLHLVERLGWALVGMAVGGFVVWAPFIPLWSKEWVLPFTLAGLLAPNLRAWLAARRYESELNKLVARVNREIERIDVAYLLSHPAIAGAAASASRVEAIAEESARRTPEMSKRRDH